MHIPTFDDILVSDTARDDYLGIFEGTGVSIAGLNCNGNPLHPNKTIGDKHAEDIRRSIRLANRLGQNRVVTMSGLPGGEPGATRVNWVVNAWNSAALDVLDYQWEVAAAFWKETDALAADHDVKVALELHPQNLVFNTADVHKLIELTGATHVGVELDASHLFWQQMDPVAVVRELGPLVFQAAAKDVRVNTENAALYGVLDNSFRRLSAGRAADQPRRRRVGQRMAQELRLGLRRPGQRPRHRLLDRIPPRPARGRPGHAGQHRARGHRTRPHRRTRSRRRGSHRRRRRAFQITTASTNTSGNVAAGSSVATFSGARQAINPSAERCSMTSEPMVVVHILGGPRDGERFATPLQGLTEGAVFRYIDADYTFVRDQQTGRWSAVTVDRRGSTTE